MADILLRVGVNIYVNIYRKWGIRQASLPTCPIPQFHTEETQYFTYRFLKILNVTFVFIFNKLPRIYDERVVTISMVTSSCNNCPINRGIRFSLRLSSSILRNQIDIIYLGPFPRLQNCESICCIQQYYHLEQMCMELWHPIQKSHLWGLESSQKSCTVYGILLQHSSLILSSNIQL